MAFMQLTIGQIVEGKITGITNFGVFADLGEGKTGMVHISEVARTYVNDIKEFVKTGDVVKMKVLNIGEDGKVSLSIKRAIGFPTILLRPTMTHSFPSISTPLRFKSCTIPAGVQDTKPGWPMLRAPTLCGWKPSTSFFGEMRFITASSSI